MVPDSSQDPGSAACWDVVQFFGAVCLETLAVACKCMNELLGISCCQGRVEFGDVAEMVEGYFTDVLDRPR